ncbi:MAG: S9 family peptidase [Anaerolineae bacterium]|nr:S9 family peptidase [Anaerolineae bacterium]
MQNPQEEPMTQNPTPPITPIKPHPITTHGHTRTDNYYWLREKENPAVIAHLEAENTYMQATTAHTADLQQTLYDEMVGRIQETDSSAPVKHGDFYYYTRTEAGQQYKIHCRKQGSLDAPEEILLDENALAEGTKYFRIGLTRISPDHTLLAYSTDTSGGEQYTVHIKNLATGDLLPDQIPHTFYSLEWANDNRTLFYTIQDDAWREYKLFRHTLGDDPTQDPELYHEVDERFMIGLDKTKDDAYIMLNIVSKETSEVRVLDANQPHAAFQLVQSRHQDRRYFVEHRDGQFYILTNDDAPNYKLMTAPVTDSGFANWQAFIPHDPDKLIEGFDIFTDHIAVYGRFQALPTLDIHTFATGETSAITFPEAVYGTRAAANPEFSSDTFRFVYTSMTTADTTYALHMDTLDWTLIKQEPVLGDYDPSNYETARAWATADDGTRIPISLLYRKGIQLDGSNPCMLYGYGSYGASMPASFDQKRLSLVDRGFIWAIAHIRGGQEMGRVWYDQGKFLHKKNTFTDFIASGKHLIAEGYTRKEKLVIMGRSAGGLLIGAVLNMAPDLCEIAVAGVPFVDVVTTMLDETIPLTVPEFEEWGNPKEKPYYDYMLSYSPYDNLEAKAYPHILVTAGLNDPRVQYWEPSKWVAKLRTLKTNDTRLVYKIFMGAGHFSSSGRYDYLKDTAFEYAFILDTLGL